MIVSLVLPGIWAIVQPSPPVPREIAGLWVPGKINVVEFADFQCPFCRKLHPLMTELLAEYEGRVHFVRLNMPLPSHSQARGAAKAYCCAEEQGHGPAMADALFQSESLTPEACEKLAESLGMSMPAFRACVASSTTEARIEDESARVRSAGLAGLPTVWIGDQVLVGLQPIDKLRDAFAEAARGGAPTRLPTALLWGTLAAVLAAFAAVALSAGKAPKLPDSL
jgi:protein-disulfide isomerase